jgi:hypothetical protein
MPAQGGKVCYRKPKDKNFFELYLPEETRAIYIRVMAIKEIITERGRYWS